jgi:AraC family transcriptional regulator
MTTGSSRLVRASTNWLGGRVELISFKHDRPVRFETSYEHAYGGLFILNGYAEPTNRKIDGTAAPRGPSRTGEINFFRMGCEVTGEVSGALEFVRLFIDPGFMHRSYDPCASDRSSAPWLTASSDLLTQRLALELSSHLKRSPRIEPLLVDGAASLLTLRLLRLANKMPPSRSAGQLSAARLRIVVDYIECNLGRDITLAELAGCVGLSTPQFCHAFRNSTGFSPHRYLIKRRVECAKVLLRRTGGDIAEIALALGFNSQSHFSHTFRMATGIAPMLYRRENS